MGLLKHDRGIQRQLTSPAAWRSVLPLATISHRGQIYLKLVIDGGVSKPFNAGTMLPSQESPAACD